MKKSCADQDAQESNLNFLITCKNTVPQTCVNYGSVFPKYISTYRIRVYFCLYGTFLHVTVVYIHFKSEDAWYLN